MFNLTRVERFIVLFLVLSALLGIGIDAYKKRFATIDVKLDTFELGRDFRRSEDTKSEDTKSMVEVVNINEASQDELMELKGIGKVMAQRIIDYRSWRGDFKYKEEIKRVKGIGDKIYREIERNISVE